MKNIEKLICRECPSNQATKCHISKQVYSYHEAMLNAYRNIERRQLKNREYEKRQYARS